MPAASSLKRIAGSPAVMQKVTLMSFLCLTPPKLKDAAIEQARINADAAIAQARINADAAIAQARINGDAAIEVARQNTEQERHRTEQVRSKAETERVQAMAMALSPQQGPMTSPASPGLPGLHGLPGMPEVTRKKKKQQQQQQQLPLSDDELAAALAAALAPGKTVFVVFSKDDQVKLHRGDVDADGKTILFKDGDTLTIDELKTDKDNVSQSIACLVFLHMLLMLLMLLMLPMLLMLRMLRMPHASHASCCASLTHYLSPSGRRDRLQVGVHRGGLEG